MITVTLRECTGACREFIHQAHTDDLELAVARAIAKVFGKGRIFCRDHGISHAGNALDGTQYGQIGYRTDAGTINLETARIALNAQRA